MKIITQENVRSPIMGSWERPLFIIVGRLEMVNKIGPPELFWGGGGGV